MNFVIIGGDAAGMSAASRAKRKKPDFDVTVLEQTKDVSYSACGMPYTIADAERNMEELVVRKAEVFREKQGINLLTGHCVTGVDREKKTLSGVRDNGTFFDLPYDKLLFATGARAFKPLLPGFDLPGVMKLKSLEEGRMIKDYIQSCPVEKAVIIGMGYVGLEMCEALVALGISVEMIKLRTGLLPWMAKELSDIVKAEVESKGVLLHMGRKIKRIDQTNHGTGASLAVVCDDRTVYGDMVLVAIGVVPNSEIAKNAGIALGAGNAISVDDALLSSDPHIYAAGDCADAIHVVTGEKTWIPLALRANRSGWAVADNVCGKRVQLDGIAGTTVFRVFGCEVARTGLNSAEAAAAGFEPVEVTIQSRSRAHAHPGSSTIFVQMVGDKKSARLLGVQMVGREGVTHRIDAPAVALHAKMSVERFFQSDLAYAPPFGPVWDPMLTAANQLLKKMSA
ncbi:MAG: FAD-dependent oxidoreductase [Desulfobacterales bacterium]